MRSGYQRPGPRGLALLAITGLVALLLAVNGWSSRGSSAALGAIGGNGAAQAPAAQSPSGSAGPTAGPAASAGTSQGAAGTPAKPGPLLSTQSFAPYSFQVWPGQRSQAAQAALAGLTVTVHRQGAGISVTASVNGQAPGAPRYYPLGARVYVVEASLGDDSGNSEYNLGDDGIVVTDAKGRILQ